MSSIKKKLIVEKSVVQDIKTSIWSLLQPGKRGPLWDIARKMVETNHKLVHLNQHTRKTNSFALMCSYLQLKVSGLVNLHSSHLNASLEASLIHRTITLNTSSWQYKLVDYSFNNHWSSIKIMRSNILIIVIKTSWKNKNHVDKHKVYPAKISKSQKFHIVPLIRNKSRDRHYRRYISIYQQRAHIHKGWIRKITFPSLFLLWFFSSPH